MPVLAADQLSNYVTQIFQAVGATPATARLVADSLVASNLAGHDSHGVIRVVQYLTQIEQGALQPAAEPRIARETPAVTIVDGGFGFGQAVCRFAMSVGIEKARTVGLSATSLVHSLHVGRLGEWVELAASQNLIALAWCNGGGIRGSVAPFGGMERRLGTNPVAAAVPVADRPPVVVDFATSATAEGKLRVSRNSGKSVPAGWILDAQGQPSTDPNDFYNDGMLLPAAGHKGYGLSMLVEFLGGLLGGNGSPLLPGYLQSNGVLFQVIDIAAFRPVDEFLAESADLCRRIKETRPAPGFDEVLLPGEPEQRIAAERRRTGIAVDAVTWSQIGEVGAKLGVPPPEVD